MAECKPTHIVLKELRDEVGATPTQLKAAKVVIDEIKRLVQAGKVEKQSENVSTGYQKNDIVTETALEAIPDEGC